MIRRRIPAITVLCILSFLVAFAPASAQDENAGRTLGGHTFMPSGQDRDPFITTYLRSGTGFAIFELPLLTTDWQGSELVLLEGDVLYLVQGFRYQQAVNDWLAVRGAFAALGRGGIDEKSVLAQGVRWAFAGELGATARFWSSERAALAVSADVALGNAYTINVLDFAEDVIEDGLDEENSLMSELGGSQGRLGLVGAWAAKRWLGVTAFMDWGWSEGSGARNWDERRLGGGSTVGIDFKELGAVPVGIRFTFSSEPAAQEGTGLDDDIRSYGVGVFYTGRPELSVGLDAMFLRLPLIDSDAEADALQLSVDMRYYF